MNSETGKWIIIAGGAIVLIGIVVYFFNDKLGWIGRLPGDIRVETENMKFYFPLVTCILISVLVSAVIYVIRKFF